MKTKFINFEGIHGSGKTACAWNLYNNLKSKGVKAKVFFEYDMNSTIENPCDIRLTSVMKQDEFDFILQKFTSYEDILRTKLAIYNGWYCIFLPDFKETSELYSLLEIYIADNGKIESKRFIQALQGKIAVFVKQAMTNNIVYIYENIMFQQVLNELMRSMSCDEEQMIQYILELEEILSPLHPHVFYLCPSNLREQIKRVAKERISANYELYPDWIDWMVEYLKDSQYGKTYNVSDKKDLMIYFQKRAYIEEKCFNILKSPKSKIITNQINYDDENEYIYKIVREHK